MHSRHIREDKKSSIGERVCKCVCERVGACVFLCLISSLCPQNPTVLTSNSSPLGRMQSYSRRQLRRVRCYTFPWTYTLAVTPAASSFNKDAHCGAHRTVLVVFACFRPLTSTATPFPKQAISYQTD